MMQQRSLWALCALFAAASLAGCQLVSGASSLDVTLTPGAEDPLDGSVRDAADERSSPGDGGPVGPGDAADGGVADADAGFQACVAEGGMLTGCLPGGNGGVVDGASNCIEYCATKGRCCAEDCSPFATAASEKAALLTAASDSACADPSSSGTTGALQTYTACSNTPLPVASRWFACCCR